MRGSIATVIALGLSAALAAPALAGGGGGGNVFRARLNGFQEVPDTISTGASGQFRMAVSRNRATYRLAYEDLEANVLFAHIHLGRPFTAGGIIVFLCDNTGAANAPADTPTCPQNGEGVTGTLTAEDVIGPEDQGLEPEAFGEFLRALRRGAAYVNVHSETFQAGEIRGQIEPVRRRPVRR